ncbi:hypothetical protein AB0N09_20000 [Streptomyces erythrochromogenes]
MSPVLSRLAAALAGVRDLAVRRRSRPPVCDARMRRVMRSPHH